MIVREVLRQDPSEVRLVQNDDVVEALPANGSDQPLDVRILPRRLRGDEHLVDAHPLHPMLEAQAVDRVAVTDLRYRGASSYGNASMTCWAVHVAVGFAVTLK